MKIRKALAVAIAACIACMAAFALSGCQQEGEYTPQLKAAEVASPAIAQDGLLRVGVNTGNSPLAGESNGKIIGIDVDVAAALADSLGLKVEVVNVGNAGRQSIENGEVDVVLGIDSSEKEKGMWFSSEYLPTGIVIFASADSGAGAPKKGDSVKIAAQVSSKSAWAVSNAFGEKKLVSENDLAAAFQALAAGEVNYVSSDAVIGLYAAYRQDIPVDIVEVIGATSGYCAMLNESNVELKDAVSRSITTLVETGVIGVIEDKWLDQTIDLSSLPSIGAKKGSSSKE